MSIQVLSNLNYPIGNIINEELRNSTTVRIAVAFLKDSGLKVIEQSLMFCLEAGCNVEIIAGLDFKTTDPKAMHKLIQLQKQTSNLRFFCFADKAQQKPNIFFHPKIYLFQRKHEMTGIVGSTNLTRGGLLTNFEANVIFKEKKSIYFSQIEAIYNSVKFAESVFSPDEKYLYGYSDIYNVLSRNSKISKNESSVQKLMSQIQAHETTLPRPSPSIKSLIIQVIIDEQKSNDKFVSLKTIYSEVERIVSEKNLVFKMDTFRNSIRGELNKHEKNSNHPDGMKLFVRSTSLKGHYSLTRKGRSHGNT